MRNMHYKIKGFRIAEKTFKSLQNLKRKHNKTYNLLFVDMISQYKKRKKNNNGNHH